MGSIPGQGTMIQHAMWHRQENKKKKKEREREENIDGTQHLSFIELLICKVNCPSTKGNSDYTESQKILLPTFWAFKENML